MERDLDQVERDERKLLREKRKVEAELTEVQTKKKKLIHNKYTYFYTIESTADGYATRYMGLFSTPALAAKSIPVRGSCHDSDRNVTWYFNVTMIQIEKDDDRRLLEVNKPVDLKQEFEHS